MKIYTKRGDSGDTSLRGGVRVPKDEIRVRAYGTLDELNSVLGMVLAEFSGPEELRLTLVRVQSKLFQLGSELATPWGEDPGIQCLESSEVVALENGIDVMESQMSPLKTFILPGGMRIASLIHFARTVSRRAERELVTLNRAEKLRPVVLQYMNRLSDYLFVAARYLNHFHQVLDIPWMASQD